MPASLPAVAHDLRLAGSARHRARWCFAFGSALAYALYLLGNGRSWVGWAGGHRVCLIVACLLALGQFLLLRPFAALAQPWPVYALALTMALFATVLPVAGVGGHPPPGAGPVALTGSLGPVVTFAWKLAAARRGHRRQRSRRGHWSSPGDGHDAPVAPVWRADARTE